MSTTEYPQDGVCEVCGASTSINDEGSTVCDGCGNPTDRCQCQRKS